MKRGLWIILFLINLVFVTAAPDNNPVECTTAGGIYDLSYFDNILPGQASSLCCLPSQDEEAIMNAYGASPQSGANSHGCCAEEHTSMSRFTYKSETSTALPLSTVRSEELVLKGGIAWKYISGTDGYFFANGDSQFIGNAQHNTFPITRYNSLVAAGRHTSGASDVTLYTYSSGWTVSQDIDLPIMPSCFTNHNEYHVHNLDTVNDYLLITLKYHLIPDSGIKCFVLYDPLTSNYVYQDGSLMDLPLDLEYDDRTGQGYLYTTTSDHPDYTIYRVNRYKLDIPALTNTQVNFISSDFTDNDFSGPELLSGMTIDDFGFVYVTNEDANTIMVRDYLLNEVATIPADGHFNTAHSIASLGNTIIVMSEAGIHSYNAHECIGWDIGPDPDGDLIECEAYDNSQSWSPVWMQNTQFASFPGAQTPQCCGDNQGTDTGWEFPRPFLHPDNEGEDVGGYTEIAGFTPYYGTHFLNNANFAHQENPCSTATTDLNSDECLTPVPYCCARSNRCAMGASVACYPTYNHDSAPAENIADSLGITSMAVCFERSGGEPDDYDWRDLDMNRDYCEGSGYTWAVQGTAGNYGDYASQNFDLYQERLSDNDIAGPWSCSEPTINPMLLFNNIFTACTEDLINEFAFNATASCCEDDSGEFLFSDGIYNVCCPAGAVGLNPDHTCNMGGAVEICWNEISDDEDTWIDCRDADCYTNNKICDPSTIHGLGENGSDFDCVIDITGGPDVCCLEGKIWDGAACIPTPPEICTTPLIDEDYDGYFDCEDSDCINQQCLTVGQGGLIDGAPAVVGNCSDGDPLLGFPFLPPHCCAYLFGGTPRYWDGAACSPLVFIPEDCTNDADDDSDGYFDCEDWDCHNTQEECTGSDIPPAFGEGGVAVDCVSLVDGSTLEKHCCPHLQRWDGIQCVPEPPEDCTSGVSDDWDPYIDCEDTECILQICGALGGGAHEIDPATVTGMCSDGAPHFSPAGPPVCCVYANGMPTFWNGTHCAAAPPGPLEICDNSIDDNGDGLIDCADLDCVISTTRNCTGNDQNSTAYCVDTDGDGVYEGNDCGDISMGELYGAGSWCDYSVFPNHNCTRFNAGTLAHDPFYCSYGYDDVMQPGEGGKCCAKGEVAVQSGFFPFDWKCQESTECYNGGAPAYSCIYDYNNPAERWSSPGWFTDFGCLNTTALPNTACCEVLRFGEINYYSDSGNVVVY